MNNYLSNQVNSPLYRRKEANTRVTAARAPSAPVRGKSVHAEVFLQSSQEDSFGKFPLPVEVYSCSKRTPKAQDTRLIDISNTPKSPKSHRLRTPKASTAEVVKKRPSIPRKLPRKSKPALKRDSPPQSQAENICKSSKIDEIVTKSLRKQREKKAQRAKEAKMVKELQEKRRRSMKSHNSNIRKLNYIKFKQERFRPKVPWGADERKLNGTAEVKLREGIKEQRAQQRAKRKRALSAGRARIGLDVFLQATQEVGLTGKCRSTSLEATPHPSCKRTKPPNVREFIKNKKKEHRRLKEQKIIQQQAEEVKRLVSLKQLDERTKKQKKPKKITKRPSDWTEESKEASFTNQDSKPKIQLVYDTEHDPQKPTHSVSPRDNFELEHTGSYEFVDVNSELSEKDLDYYASKMQALVRGFLARQRFARQLYEDEDEEVVHILGKSHIARSEHSSDELSEYASLEATQQKKDEFQDTLKNQLVWRDLQMQNLEVLRNQDLKDIQSVLASVDKNSRVEKALSEIIERRYQHLAAVLEGNIESVERVLTKELNDQQLQQLEEELMERREYLIRQSGMAESSEDESSEEEEICERPSKYIEEWEPETLDAIHKEDNLRLSWSSDEPQIPEFRERIPLVATDLPLQSKTPADKSSVTPAHESSYIEDSEDSLIGHIRIDQLRPEHSGRPSNTPDSIPERPQAPLQELESDEDKSPIPDVSSRPGLWENSSELNPDQMNVISELMLRDLINENNEKLSKIQVPPLTLIERDNSLSPEPRIHTDTATVKKYVDEIYTASQGTLEEINRNLRTTLVRKPLNVLIKMQETEIGSLIEPEFLEFPPILHVELYLSLEKPREERSTSGSMSPNTMQIVAEAEHIHNKLIFDAVNEALQKYRPYGVKGPPLPWSYSIRTIASSTATLEECWKNIASEIEQWSQVQAGKIPGSDVALSSGIMDEELLHHIREEKLANLLADEVLNKDGLWVDYEFEESQVNLDVADMILEHLVAEGINLLS